MKRLLKRFIKPLVPKKIRTALTWNVINTGKEPAYWGNFPIVKEIFQKRVTGDPSLSWYTKQVQKRTSQFGRTLAFGDGNGMAIEAALSRHDTSEVIYFNISKGEGKRFLKLFKDHRFDFPYRFVRGDANRFDFTSLGAFDTIISVGSFHHFENFDGIFPQLNRILKPDGILYADEFIGPTMWKYDPSIIDQINQWLRNLSTELIRNRKPIKNDDFFLLWKHGIDPSECIRSSELDKKLRQNFEVIEAKPFGGTLLHPFFLTSQLHPCRLNIPNWHHKEIGKETLRKLSMQEDEWISSGKLQPHYVYYVLTNKSDKK
jgi:SAM-dependent methyltransferase